jgi:hypothetical protein
MTTGNMGQRQMGGEKGTFESVNGDGGRWQLYPLWGVVGSEEWGVWASCVNISHILCQSHTSCVNLAHLV